MLRDQKSGFARISGHRLYYETYGFDERGTILVVPGGPGLGHDYLHSLSDLAPLGYRVVFYDPLGCGRSEQPRKVSECTLRHSVEEVDGVRRALRISRPLHLFGHSYGGRVALEAAVQAPRRFASLILSSPSVRLPGVDRVFHRTLTRLPRKAREFMRRNNPQLEDIWDSEVRGGYRRYCEGYESFVRSRVCRLKVAPYDLVHTMQNMNSKVAMSIVGSQKAYYGTSSPEDTARQYERLNVPCLLTVGRYDQIPPSHVRALQRRIPHAKLVVFGRSSHLPNWEEREQFIETVDRYLRRVS